jgi:hypothetical protein
MRQSYPVLIFMEQIIKDIWMIKQSDSAVFLITKSAWEEHKKYVLKIFQEDNAENAEEDFSEYMQDFSINFLKKDDLDYLLNKCDLKVNETYQITSFQGDLMRF